MSIPQIIEFMTRREGPELRLCAILGQGESGVFYLLEETETGRRYGIKFFPLRVWLRLPPELLVASVSEASRVFHPNVAATFEVGFTEGQIYLIREFVPGAPLAAHARRDEMSLLGLLNVAYQSATALRAAHRLGVTHQDLNPNNVIITPGHEVKLVDFGVGEFKRMVEAHEGLRLDEPDLDVKERKWGTVEGRPEGDIYSLGEVLYFAAHGQALPAWRPLTGLLNSTVPALLDMQRRERLRLPAALSLGRMAVERLGHSIDQLLAPSPQDRPTTDELLSELGSIYDARGRPYSAPRWPGSVWRARAAPERGGGGPVVIRRGRQVNAWLVNGEMPLVRGRQYKVGVNIGAPREGGLGNWPFTEPEWGGRTELKLLLSLTAVGVDVSPASRRTVLHREKNMRAVYFKITPRDAGTMHLHLSIFLARELTLLEEFRIGIVVEEEVEEAA